MYTQPELKDYQDEWLRVERELAIKSMEMGDWYTAIYNEASPSENTPAPTDEAKKQGSRDNFTEADFMKALKKASRPIRKL